MTGATEDETFRATLQGRTPDNVITTLIVTRQGVGRGGRVWLTLAGSIRCTAVLTDDQAGELASVLTAAARTRP